MDRACEKGFCAGVRATGAAFCMVGVFRALPGTMTSRLHGQAQICVSKLLTFFLSRHFLLPA